MSSSLKLSLTDGLREFVNQHSGDGTLYVTPSEFVRDLVRQKMRQLEAQELREGVLEGLQDIADGRKQEFKGSLANLLKKPLQTSEGEV